MAIVARDPSLRTGTILLLNGASSSGKSSIARALREHGEHPYHHLQLDAFRAMEPPRHWEGWQSRGPDTALKLAALCRGMNAALVEYAGHGQDVIFDTELSDPDAWQYVRDDLSDLPVLMVGVTCSLDVLARRERDRGDRPIGLAARQFDRVHRDKVYDLTIDTTSTRAVECAGVLAKWLRRSPVPSAFPRMCGRRLGQHDGAAARPPV